mgnify:CR=1 FL=1
MKLTTFKHSSGVCELYLDYDKDYKEFILCAIDRDIDGKNVCQIDLDAYSEKEFNKLIKKMKKYAKNKNDK